MEREGLDWSTIGLLVVGVVNTVMKLRVLWNMVSWATVSLAVKRG
jgi:hypothetical protein